MHVEVSHRSRRGRGECTVVGIDFVDVRKTARRRILTKALGVKLSEAHAGFLLNVQQEYLLWAIVELKSTMGVY